MRAKWAHGKTTVKGVGGGTISMINTMGKTNTKRNINKSIVHKEKHER
jgi:hypothetical protein